MERAMKQLRRTILAGLGFATAAAAACDRAPSADVVARAADNELSATETAALITSLPVDPQFDPAQPEVVMALADLWIDYTLLATAAADDSTLSSIDLQPIVAQQTEVELITALRDSVIQVDTALTEDAVRARFAQEAPDARVSARHILLAAGAEATPAQRDSARALAGQLLQRLRNGENFEALARQYSADGTAAQGGDLGFFGRGEMVASFDSAAFLLEPGQLSDVVTTIFGYHIIRVDEKQMPEFAEFADETRQMMQAEMFMKAESLFVTGVEQRANLEIAEDAAEVTREIARNPLARMSGRSARRTLVEFEGGDLTVGEVRTFLQTRQPNYRQQVVDATAEQINENILRALSQRELLLAEARSRGIVPNQARTDSLVEMARTGFVDAARQLGLIGIQPAEGESREQAIGRTVSELLRGILNAEREVIPLGAISFTLRQQYTAEVNDAGVQRVVTQVTASRGAQPSVPFQMPMPETPMPADTAPPTPPPGG
jgi:peptidyl-prolyl cis-trans isomerase C